MTFASSQYLRVGAASAAALGPVGSSVEAESVQDMLNNMHPAVAVLHSIFEQPAQNSVAPNELIDYHDIDRTTSITSTSSFALQAGQSTTVRAAKYPSRLYTRLQTYHEGVAASREAQQIKLYGISDAQDYGVDNLLVRHMDIWERILHFGQGTNDASGSSGTPAGPAPRTHGLIGWLTTGLERRSGSGVPTDVDDGINTNILKTYWTSFWDAGGSGLTRDNLYSQTLTPANLLGHDSDGAMLLCSYGLMNAFSDFNFVPGRGVVNERQIPARDQAIEDIVTTITTPTCGTVFLVPDRYLSVDGASVTIDTSTSYGGSVNKTLYVDEMLISLMPSKFAIETMQGISYKELASDGDYALGMLVAQKGLSCKNLFGIAGACNLRP